jgi:hypothetical protein
VDGAPQTAPASYGSGEDGSLPEGFPDSPDRYIGEGNAPTPYTAAEIRAHSGEGRINKWRMVSSKGEFISVQRFLGADARGAKIQSFLTRADGVQSGSGEDMSGTWEEFQSHASYPAEQTVITSDRVNVPAGEFDCWLYRVREEPDTVLRFWFAKDLPGPPVRVEIERSGAVDLDMQLVEYVAGESR